MKNLVYADFDSIVFEGRHREYGAYQMRKRYNRYLIRALLLTFMAFIAVTGFPKFMDWIMPKEVVAKKPITKMVEWEALPPPPVIDEEIAEVTPPPPPEPPAIKTVAFLVPNPTPDDLVSDSATIADVDALDSVVIALVDQDGMNPDDFNYDFNKIGIGDEPDVVVVKQETEIPVDTFFILDSEPRPVNMDELTALIGYPAMAKEAEIQGKVILRVLLDKTGHYVKHVVIKDPHPILTQAVSKHINKLQMTPGVQAGKPIKVWVTVPFNFTLLH